ncbi:MAG: hypothetical protein ABI240_18230, partial [Sphingomonas sp.]
SSLNMIVGSQSFEDASQDLVEIWGLEGAGLDAVEPTLKFMEGHATIDYGSPGPLTHFIEQFHGHGYDELLLASVRRSPTAHTVWLLNRLINGTPDENKREAQIRAMRDVAVRQSASEDARSSAVGFLKRLDG